MKKIIKHIYSLMIKFKFYSCGSNLRIHYPIKIYNPGDIQIGNNVSIFENSWFNCINSEKKPSLIIGSNCSIGRFTHINAYQSVIIEDDVVIAERVHISDASHNYSDLETPIINQGTEFVGEILIKYGSWIGSGAVILPGVTIGRNAIVGANAVVSSNVPDFHIARGVPAKIYKNKKI
jgi:carbonic anhydrase/acetyltransferase-like protein (isoleucine patch superfamily)